MHQRVLGVLVMAALVGCSGQEAANDTAAMETPEAAPSTITIPAGTSLLVRLQGEIMAEQNQAGDTFTAVLVDPVMAGERELVPAGTPFMGRIEYLAPADGKDPVSISLSLVEIDGKPAHTDIVKLVNQPRLEDGQEMRFMLAEPYTVSLGAA
jgi:hypothetical protein